MRFTHFIAPIALSIAVLGGARTAPAFESTTTSIAEKACRKIDVVKIDDSEYASSRVCPGRGGYKVFVDEEDLRETLTVGKTIRQAGKEPAARDRYGAFNSYDDTVEWRGDGNPYAVIAGWSFADNEHPNAARRPNSVRLLVVLRLPPGPVCKVAYVDRAANVDAAELARKAGSRVISNAAPTRCG
jgi:hypothetical protein